ncbi:hypothetical protein NBO_66g0048 [Nosema bombycis CQ1]|uniref:Uncharacterized protein n=1 Tax=Nosema bombycis (strain CQ1 / CVCC 102059) TaxID=578461 RepID=R0M6G0_NOSB1|nr:hypothetical protein NBO_66g0048 [Nosema bombycis CQ1]|eukprot:EOB13589.1 hypothetical protein NBO_66g0048 [Nosema bombycis CQ1]
MFKISIILYLLSDIACASNYELSYNDREFSNVSVNERARLFEVNRRNLEIPRKAVNYSLMRSGSGSRQGSLSPPKDFGNSFNSQKLGARPVNNKYQYEYVRSNSPNMFKYSLPKIDETSFTYETERSYQDKKSTGTIPKQTNENSFTVNADVHEEQQSFRTSENQQFIRTSESKQTYENSGGIDKYPQYTRQLKQTSPNQSSETSRLVLRHQNKSNCDDIETPRESKKRSEISKYKKGDDGVSDCTSALFCFLDCFFG